jgi:hypothetical protein
VKTITVRVTDEHIACIDGPDKSKALDAAIRDALGGGDVIVGFHTWHRRKEVERHPLPESVRTWLTCVLIHDETPQPFTFELPLDEAEEAGR